MENPVAAKETASIRAALDQLGALTAEQLDQKVAAIKEHEAQLLKVNKRDIAVLEALKASL